MSGESGTAERATETVPENVEAPATVALLGVFLAVFLAFRVLSAQGNEEVIYLLGVQSDHLLRVWTWVTANLVHVIPIHLLVNSVFLYTMGRWAERAYGTRRFLAVLGVTGVAAAVLGTVLAGMNQCGVAAFRAGGCTVSGGGSSMMLTGLLGFLTRQRPRAQLTLLPQIRVPLWGFTAGFLVVSVLGMYTPVDPLRLLLGFAPGHAYHFVGLLLGLALGTVWRPEVRR